MADDRLTNFYVDYNIEDTTARDDATFVQKMGNSILQACKDLGTRITN